MFVIKLFVKYFNLIVEFINNILVFLVRARDGFAMFLLGDIKFSAETIDTFIFILQRRLKSSDLNRLPNNDTNKQNKNSGTDCDNRVHSGSIH